MKGDVWFPSSGDFPVEGSGLWAQGHGVCCVCTCSMRFVLFPQATAYVLMFPADVFPLLRKNVWEECNADTILPRGRIQPGLRPVVLSGTDQAMTSRSAGMPGD